MLASLIAAGHETENAKLWLARLQLETGKYELAEKGAAAIADGETALAQQGWLLLADVLSRQGQHERAIEILRPMSRKRHAFEAQRLLGEILVGRGRRKEAEPVLLQLIEAYNDGRISEEQGRRLALVGRAAHLLRSPEDANEAYIEAEHSTPKDLRLLLWRAELFLDAHDPDQAAQVMAEALQIAPENPEVLALLAHIKLDQALDFAAADALVERAVAVNPQLPRAHFVLAGIALRDGEIERADAALDRGLRYNPEHLELLSMKAAVRFVAEDPEAFEHLVRRVLTQNPGYSQLYRIVGTYADWEHRYKDLVSLMRQALSVDGEDAKARALLGFNLIRSGEEHEGVGALRNAFEQDPFDVRVLNTLNLYEQVIASSYQTVRAGRFVIRYHKDERALLERYVPGLLDSAWEILSKAHGFEPPTPIGIELYAERRSFAVRTSGLPHTAIQGVCFGETLATMTPQHENFNFGMTLWHELAHVFHIQLSRSRVPRWFTEGLAEYETLLARPEWRREQDRELYEAFRSDSLPAVALMNRVFTHAERMEDVALAYYASSRIVAQLAEHHGRPALTSMLRAWGEGKDTGSVLQQVLGSGAESVDRSFREFLRRDLARYDGQFIPKRSSLSLQAAWKAVKRHPENADVQADLLRVQLAEGVLDDAKATAERLRSKARTASTPELLWLEARLAIERERRSEAESRLQRLAQEGYDGYDVRMLRARLAAESRAPAEERAQLEEARRFDPTQSAPLVRLVMLAQRNGEVEAEIALLEQLAQREQHNASVYRQLLSRLVQTGRFDEAVKWGEAAQWVDIHGFETHRLWAEAFSATGETGRAVFELESALLCDAPAAKLALAHHQAALIFRRMGRIKDAKRHERSAESID